MLALDFGVFREAIGWTIAWVTLAMLFELGIWHYADSQKALEFTAGYLIEHLLSADNIFVFALLFSYFAVPVWSNRPKESMRKHFRRERELPARHAPWFNLSR